MHVLRIYFFLIILLLTAGCSAGLIPTEPDPPEPPEPTVDGLEEVTPPLLNFSPTYMLLAGDRMLVSESHALHVFDVSDPSNPVWLTEMDAELAPVRIIASEGDYVYLVSSEVMYIYDISQPVEPYEVGTADVPIYPSVIAVEGGYVYITDTKSSMLIFDIDPPASAHLVKTFYTIQNVNQLAVSEGIAYLGTYSYGMQIIDVSNPQSPEILNTVDHDGYMRGLCISDGYAYLSISYDGLVIVDVSSPESAHIIHTIPMDRPNGAAIQDDYLYVMDYGYTGADYSLLHIIDISEPASAQIVSTVEIQGDYYEISPGDGYAYCVNYSDGLQVIDIDPPESAAVVDVRYALYNPGDISIDENTVCISDRYSGVKVVDISNPVSAEVVGSIPAPSIYRVLLKDNFVYFNESRIFRIADLDQLDSNPVVGELEMPGYFGDFVVDSGYALFTGAGFEIYIADIDPPGAAYVVHTLEMEQLTDSIATRNGYVYACGTKNGLAVIDLNTPGVVDIVTTVSITGDIGYTKIAVGDDRLYVTSSSGYWEGDWNYSYYVYTDNYLDIFDISEPASPVLLNTLETSGHTEDIAVGNGSVYLANGETGLQRVDASIPGSEFIVEDFAIDGRAAGVGVDEEYAYVVSPGLRIYKLD